LSTGNEGGYICDLPMIFILESDYNDLGMVFLEDHQRTIHDKHLENYVDHKTAQNSQKCTKNEDGEFKVVLSQHQ